MYRAASALAALAVVAHGAKGAGKQEAPSSASSSSAPLLTASSAYAFVKDSIVITKDVTYFVGSTLALGAWAHVPPNLQKQVSDQYTEITAKVDTLRVQNGVPSFSTLLGDLESEYTKKVAPLVEKASDAISKLVLHPFGFAQKFVAAFEKAYPEHEGKLPIATPLDLALVAVFLFYFVFTSAWKVFCYTCCCGCCARRAPGKPELVKPSRGNTTAKPVHKKKM